jgi:hypothetical protein
MANDKASTPFSTADGKPINPQPGAKPADLLVTPTGSGVKSGGRDFTQENRPQSATETPGDRTPWMQSRPQTAGSPEERVNPTSIAPGGIVMKADPGKASRGIGAQGLDRPVPFKNMNGTPPIKRTQ